MIICAYHRADFDGVCSAAIVGRYAKQINCEIRYVGLDYPDSSADMVKAIHEAAKGSSLKQPMLVMVDFTIESTDAMEDLSAAYAMTWIDHHDTSVKACQQNKFFTPCQTRVSDNTWAGCELTWQEFFPDEPMPTSVALLGRYDVWDHRDPNVVSFQYGLRRYNPKPWDDVWHDALSSGSIYWRQIAREGEAILDYVRSSNAKAAKCTAFGFVDRGWTFCAGNAVMANTDTLKSEFGDADHAAMTFYRLSDGRWKYTVSRINDSEFDAGEYAKFYGGGGRRDVGGFVLDKLLF